MENEQSGPRSATPTWYPPRPSMLALCGRSVRSEKVVLRTWPGLRSEGVFLLLCRELGSRSCPHSIHPQSRTRSEASTAGREGGEAKERSASWSGPRTPLLLCPTVDGAKGAPMPTDCRATVVSMSVDDSRTLEGSPASRTHRLTGWADRGTACHS
jgi:hypothetical protein